MSLCTKSKLSGGASKGAPPKIWTGKWTEGGHTYWLTHFKSRLPKKKRHNNNKSSYNDNSSWFISLKLWPMRGYMLVFIYIHIYISVYWNSCGPIARMSTKNWNVHKQIGLVCGRGRELKNKGKIQLVVQRRAMATLLNCCYSPEIQYLWLYLYLYL